MDLVVYTAKAKVKIEEAIELLGPIENKMGAYSSDALTHAEHVIENASERAKQTKQLLNEALECLKGYSGPLP